MSLPPLSPEGTLLVSIVIPCLDCPETIGRLVHALRAQRLPENTVLEILVVDNGSGPDTLKILEGLPARILHESTPGPAAARNLGIRSAGGEVIIFMDADTRPAASDVIAQHLATFSLSEDIGIAGGAITPDPEQKSLLAFAENATGLFNWHDRRPAGDLTYQPLGNLATRKSVIEEIGLLDEQLQWLEDFEWNQRICKSGYRIYFNPKAGVYIRGRESLGKILIKFFRWGLHVREIYIPGRRNQVWVFPDRPGLFFLNAPLRILNETWVTVKRWYRVHPGKTFCLIPVFLLFRTAWGLGMVTGAHRFFSKSRAQKPPLEHP